jgi:acetyl esterase/lipase
MSEASASTAARWTCALLRRFVKPRLRKLLARGQGAQKRFEHFVAQQSAPFAPQIRGEWLPAGNPPGTLFYLHGGGFLLGSPRLFRYAARPFARAGFNVFAPAYRLAPEHVFPAALDDVFCAYRALLSASPGPILLAGDSAGGGLAVSLMLRLREAGLPLPVAAALFSPWTDLAATGASARENEEKDALFTRRLSLIGARAVLRRASARDPLPSPLYAYPSGLPPMLIHVGRDETLRDDSTRLAERALAAGVDARIELWSGVPHAWQLMPFIPEARESRNKAIDFLKERLAARDVRS